MATIITITNELTLRCFNPLLFVFFIRPDGLPHVAYLLRQNYDYVESDLIKSEKGNPVYHTNSPKRPGH